MASLNQPNISNTDPLMGRFATNRQPNSGKTACCSKPRCTKKCCGITTAVIILVVIIAIGTAYGVLKSMLTGTASSEDADLWKEKLSLENDIDQSNAKTSKKLAKSLIDGRFLLVSFDENFKTYLESMESIPSFVISLILKSREEITFTQPTTPGGNWTVKTVTDLSSRSNFFRSGFNSTTEAGFGGKKVEITSNCTVMGKDQNILQCHVYEKMNDLKFFATSTYTRRGFINERTFLNKGITTKKYYERLSQLEYEDGSLETNDNENDELSKEIKKAKENEKPEEENPFSTSDEEDDFDDFE